MSRSLLSGLHDIGEACVQGPSARRRLARGNRGSQQRMGESKALAIELEDPRGDRLAQAGLGFVADGELHERQVGSASAATTRARSSAAGPRRSRRACRSSSRSDGNRQLLARRNRAALTLECARKLENEERVATRGLPEFDQRRSRKCRVEAGAEQLADRTNVQARELDREHPLLRHAAAKPVR